MVGRGAGRWPSRDRGTGPRGCQACLTAAWKRLHEAGEESRETPRHGGSVSAVGACSRGQKVPEIGAARLGSLCRWARLAFETWPPERTPNGSPKRRASAGRQELSVIGPGERIE